MHKVMIVRMNALVLALVTSYEQLDCFTLQYSANQM